MALRTSAAADSSSLPAASFIAETCPAGNNTQNPTTSAVSEGVTKQSTVVILCSVISRPTLLVENVVPGCGHGLSAREARSGHPPLTPRSCHACRTAWRNCEEMPTRPVRKSFAKGRLENGWAHQLNSEKETAGT
jgi:hypothetical protein